MNIQSKRKGADAYPSFTKILVTAQPTVISGPCLEPTFEWVGLVWRDAGTPLLFNSGSVAPFPPHLSETSIFGHLAAICGTISARQYTHTLTWSLTPEMS